MPLVRQVHPFLPYCRRFAIAWRNCRPLCHKACLSDSTSQGHSGLPYRRIFRLYHLWETFCAFTQPPLCQGSRPKRSRVLSSFKCRFCSTALCDPSLLHPQFVVVFDLQIILHRGQADPDFGLKGLVHLQLSFFPWKTISLFVVSAAVSISKIAPGAVPTVEISLCLPASLRLLITPLGRAIHGSHGFSRSPGGTNILDFKSN